MNEDGDVVEGEEPINAAAFAIHSESMYEFKLYFNSSGRDDLSGGRAYEVR